MLTDTNNVERHLWYIIMISITSKDNFQCIQAYFALVGERYFAAFSVLKESVKKFWHFADKSRLFQPIEIEYFKYAVQDVSGPLKKVLLLIFTYLTLYF